MSTHLRADSGRDPMEAVALDPVRTEDVLAAITSTRPACASKGLAARYAAWRADFESV